MKSDGNSFMSNDNELITVTFKFYFDDKNMHNYRSEVANPLNSETNATEDVLPSEFKGFSQGKTVRSKEAAAAYIAQINKDYGGCSEIKIQE